MRDIAVQVLGALSHTELQKGLRHQMLDTLKLTKSCLHKISDHLSKGITCIQEVGPQIEIPLRMCGPQIQLCEGLAAQPVLHDFTQFMDVDGNDKFLLTYNAQGGRLRTDSQEGLVVVRGFVTASDEATKLVGGLFVDTLM